MITTSINIIILTILIISCSNSEIKGLWHLEGENITFDFKKKQLILKENKNIILVANKTISNNNDLNYKIVNLDPAIKSKYSVNSFISFSKIINKDSLITSNIKLPNSDYRYTLTKNNKTNISKDFSLLYDDEIKDFLKDGGFELANKKYLIRSSNKKDKISNLVDKKYSSYWHKKINYKFNDFFELFFYSKNKEKLDSKVKVRGIGFINRHAQNYESIKAKDNFHRIRKIEIQFTGYYNGGIGKTKALYDNLIYSIELDDKPGLQIIYFYKSIFCKGIKLIPKDIYTGLKNELRLYEIIFYIE